MGGVESRFTSSFLLSLTLLEPLIPRSHPLFLSSLLCQHHFIMLLELGVSVKKSKIEGAPPSQTVNLAESVLDVHSGPGDRASPVINSTHST